MRFFDTRAKKTVLLCATATFFAAEAVLGLLLQTADAYADHYRYVAVLLACLFCTLFASRSPSYLLTQAALLCTVGADWFLVMREPREQLPAMIFFLGTQLSYFLRLYFEDTSHARRRVHLYLRTGASVFALALTWAVLGERCDALSLVSVLYYAHLILNLTFAFLQTGISFFSVGLLFFLLCDTVVGLSCIDPYLPIPADSPLRALLSPGFDLVWAFYVPSQALLAASLVKKDGRGNHCDRKKRL
jgi:hypothetical protein